MPLTPETLPRHELNGLHVEVVDAPNPDLVGNEGRVVRETTRTLHVAPDGDAERRERSRVVPKSGTTFEFALYERASGHATDEAAADRKAAGTTSELPSDTAGGQAGQSGGASERRSEARRTPAESDGGEGVAYVTVDGARLLSRPARRTETGGIPKWR